jgi:Fur family ferric uptake transcriptional regulator
MRKPLGDSAFGTSKAGGSAAFEEAPPRHGKARGEAIAHTINVPPKKPPRPPAERNTRQKRAIRDAFEENGRPLSTAEVHAAAARRSPGLGIATVYRAIKTLLDEGWLTVVEIPGQGPFYEIAGKAHHHHFACEECAAIYELEECHDVKTSLPRGFRARGHDVIVYGTCGLCVLPKGRRGSGAARKQTAVSPRA